MCKNNISLNSDKLSAHFKKLNNASASCENLYFFDFKHLLQTFLFCSEIRDKLYFDMTHFVDYLTKFWHSRAWVFSLCTISDQYAHSVSIEQSLFSFDFVRFKCDVFTCVCYDTSKTHMSRILKVRIDHRNQSREHIKEKVILKIQKTLEYFEISFLLNSSLLINEILLSNECCYALKSFVDHETRIVTLDYSFQSRVISNDTEHSGNLIVQQYLNTESHVCSLCQSHLIREELELREFTWNHFLVNFDQHFSKCLSLSLTSFIDDFDLYKNFYRSLMRIYFLIAVYSNRNRNRMSNVLSLTLSSYDSNMNDAVRSFHFLFQLDEDI